MIDLPTILQAPVRPRATLAVLAYQQEHLIAQAIRGAFAQTYSPLQIILSDDHSADGTFSVMREMAEQYRGPHRVVLNRNASNLGTSAHNNAVAALADGELFIVADGDDVSLPHRTQWLVAAWLARGRPSMMLSAFDCVDEAGAKIGEGPSRSTTVTPATLGQRERQILKFIETWDLAVVGATLAMKRDLLEVFGPLPSGRADEDDVLALRALLLDGLEFIPDRLIQYRQHGANVSGRRWTRNSIAAHREREWQWQVKAEYRIGALRAYRVDLERAVLLGLLRREMGDSLVRRIGEELEIEAGLCRWWSMDWSSRAGWYARHFHRKSSRVTLGWWLLPRMLPLRAFAALGSVMIFARRALKPYLEPVRERFLRRPAKPA